MNDALSLNGMNAVILGLGGFRTTGFKEMKLENSVRRNNSKRLRSQKSDDHQPYIMVRSQ
jgi:hypothetical protein